MAMTKRPTSTIGFIGLQATNTIGDWGICQQPLLPDGTCGWSPTCAYPARLGHCWPGRELLSFYGPPPRWTLPPRLGRGSPARKRLSARWGRGHDALWSYPSHTRSRGRLHRDEVTPVHTATHLQGLVQRWVQIPRLSCHGEVSMGRGHAGQGSYGEPRDGEVATAPARGVRAAVRALWVEACIYDRRALVICLYVPVALTLLEYMFRPSRARYWMPLTPYL